MVTLSAPGDRLRANRVQCLPFFTSDIKLLKTNDQTFAECRGTCGKSSLFMFKSVVGE